MSALSFLVPDATTDTAIARAPAEHLARAAGARFELRAGWNVAVSFGDQEHRWLTETVGFADRSQLCKLELHGPPGPLGALAEQVRAAGATWCELTPSRALVLAEAPLGLQSPDSAVTIVDVTCGLTAMALAGPGCRELLARFCALDVRDAVTPVGAFRPGSIARTPGYLLRTRADELLILVGWAFGEYLYELVADAAESLGGGPVGADALAAHGEPAHA
jgi:heterotetrameric sarcosine oxidase gamma subunit